jgi:redox-sensitive bicupin YhaK (pirin superfamily)
MQTDIRKAGARGLSRFDWLTSYHSFSFGSYRDKTRINFGALRVLNDDSVAPGMGFGLHPHNDMEIITIPLSGALEHQDNYGHRGVIKPGDIQVMTAGTGIIHSEYNQSSSTPVSFLQIWIIPETVGAQPSYTQRSFDPDGRKNAFQLVAGPQNGSSLKINQQAYVSLAEFESGKSFTYKIKKEGNGVYLFVIDGRLMHGEDVIERRDAMEICETMEFSCTALIDSYLLALEVPMDI